MLEGKGQERKPGWVLSQAQHGGLPNADTPWHRLVMALKLPTAGRNLKKPPWMTNERNPKVIGLFLELRVGGRKMGRPMIF